MIESINITFEYQIFIYSIRNNIIKFYYILLINYFAKFR
jgi:hypothetical protein